jgi:hypothetical protein
MQGRTYNPTHMRPQMTAVAVESENRGRSIKVHALPNVRTCFTAMCCVAIKSRVISACCECDTLVVAACVMQTCSAASQPEQRLCRLAALAHCSHCQQTSAPSQVGGGSHRDQLSSEQLRRG